MARTCGTHKNVGKEGFQWANEEVDAGLGGSSEVEHKAFLQDGALMKFEVEEYKLPRVMVGFEVVGAAESTVGEEAVDVAVVVVLLAEEAMTAEEEVTGNADLRVLVIDQVVGSNALSEA